MSPDYDVELMFKLMVHPIATSYQQADIREVIGKIPGISFHEKGETNQKESHRGMIRTLKLVLRHDTANSWPIVYHATQQNAAYNQAVDVPDHETALPKSSGRNHPNAMNKRITACRQVGRQEAGAPYHIHPKGGEQVRNLTSGYDWAAPSGSNRSNRASPKVRTPSIRRSVLYEVGGNPISKLRAQSVNTL